MEDKLRIKIAIGDLDIELEGNSSIVIEQFDKLKTDGLGKIIQNYNVESSPKIVKETPPPQKQDTVKKSNPNESHKDDFPSLRDIFLRDLPKNEKEWLVIYGFYISGFELSEFKREDLITKYSESNRRTESRIANLSNNLKSLTKLGLVKSLNDTDLILTSKGSDLAKEIINRG